MSSCKLGDSSSSQVRITEIQKTRIIPNPRLAYSTPSSTTGSPYITIKHRLKTPVSFMLIGETKAQPMENRERKLLRRQTFSFEDALASPRATKLSQLFGKFWSILVMLIPRAMRVRWQRLRSQFVARLTQRYFGLNTSNKIRFSAFDSIEKEVVTLDGARLRTTHLAPHTSASDTSAPQQSPCIILRTPYYRQFMFLLAVHLVHRGYHVLLQDVRGRFESTGEFTMGRNEKKDAASTFRWIAQQPWSNKEIGLIGVSMDGYTSWASFASSLENDVGVKVRAIVPALTSSDILKSGIYAAPTENRADPVVHLELIAKYSGLMYELNYPRKSFGSQLLWVIFKCTGYFVETRKRRWQKEVAMHLPLSTIDIAATTAIPEPRLELITNPDDQYWSDIDHSWAVKKLSSNGSHAAFITGWYDIFTHTTLRDFQLAVEGVPVNSGDDGGITLTIGDYSHFDDYFSITMREAIRTFENALPSNTDVKHYPKRRKRVRVICLGADGFFFQTRPIWEKALAALSPAQSSFSTLNESHHAWREFDFFPPKEAQHERLKLAPAMRILPANPNALGPRFNPDDSDVFMYDPHTPTPTLGGALFDLYSGILEQTPLMNRDDVLYYQTPELKEVVEIAGNVHFDCFASSSARSMDIFAKLCITNKDGSTYNLCEGIARKTLDISQGEEWPQKISVNVGPICAQFIKGSKICLIVSSGSFPRYSRNLGYGEPVQSATTMTSAKQRIFWSRSTLSLPVTQGSIYKAIRTAIDIDEIIPSQR